MTSKIKALNEEEQSFEDDSDLGGRPSKEAQEELRLLKYKEALQTLAAGRKQDAVELLEDIVSEEDLRQLSPSQQKLQFGCLKVLGDLYRDGECKDLERCKLMYERAIYFDQSGNNITFWYRLGKVCYELGDLHSAFKAFAQTLLLRPSHWNCLEHIVTVSYVVHEYEACLDYCVAGLTQDPGFFKGHVFLDLVLKIFPELETAELKRKRNCPPTQIPKDQQEVLRKKYLDELQQVTGRLRQRSELIRSHIVIPTPQIHFKFRMLTWSNLVRELLQAYENISGTVEFHRPVEITWTLEDGVSTESDDRQFTNDESQTEEDSQVGVVRSRSSSDDKESNVALADQENDSVDKNSADNLQESQGLDGPSTQETDGGNNKKKNRKDVKWWQIEGKRRSQRVRGHLMPVSPDKTKKESSFADQLKNLIPPSLLGDDGTSNERELVRVTEKPGWTKKSRPAYFGTRDEETEVKQMLGKLGGQTWSVILSSVVHCLCTQVKYPWPNSLREMFLDLYTHVRILMNYPSVQTCSTDQIVGDCYACVCLVEVAIEKYKTELSVSDLQYCKAAVKAIYFLEECLQSSHSIPVDLMLRVKWMTVRRLLQLSVTSNDEEINGSVCSILGEIETELRCDPKTVWTVNESYNLICLESVVEKASGITKMQNSQTVTDLFQSEQYESLIGVLQANCNFVDIEKRDLSDIYYYTVALHRTGSTDCIHHCVNVINQSVKFQDNNVLSEALLLFENIWKKLSAKFTLQDKRSTVGCMLKILVAGERKPPCQESILTVPWCVLHSVMFSMEKDEPVLYLEEETVPNSVLLLQMAHECMSRTEKCCIDGGKLMLYTMQQILEVKKRDEYFAYEETRLCMEQAIFCMYSHPSKKSKVKNLKDHQSVSTVITWEVCPTLYQYYCPDELPEFDSVAADSIGTEVESLFQRFLEIMPKSFHQTERKEKYQKAIDTADDSENFHSDGFFPNDIRDIYYLIADHHFKNKEWAKAVSYYTWDLAVCGSRFDSWAAIALSMGENINTRLNNADDIDFCKLLQDAQSTSFCFRNALKIQRSNIKLRIEFGSFVYAMHAYCSRLMKQQAPDIDMQRFMMIEKAKDTFLKSSFECFDIIPKQPTNTNESTDTVEEELWIHHYMLGKINEKMVQKNKPELFLTQYEIAGQLLCDLGAPYPAKLNTYTPPEHAIEALEIYYRVHASVLNLIDLCDYSFEMEKLLLKYIRHQENSPFMKNKQSKEGTDNKRGRKAAEEAVSKKEMAEVTAVMNDLLDKTEKLVETSSAQSVTSSATSTTTTEDESSTDSVDSSAKPQLKSFSLSAFCERIREEEQRKTSPEIKKLESAIVNNEPTPEPETQESIYEGLDGTNTHFYNDFKDVKFGGVVSLCLKAMEECISRYPSHFKSYIRIAQTYLKFLNDPKTARDYLMGSPALSQRKITGLFGDRKPTNFYNGIWRNPSDDLERPGSFAYHMNKAMTLLLDVLSRLNDHQLLADIGIYLNKVPDNEKKYLSNTDRENLCSVAWNCSSSAVKKITADTSDNINEVGIEVFDTYSKCQKHYARGNLQIFSACLHDLYKKFLISQGYNDNDGIMPVHAITYFSQQYATMKQSASRTNSKSSVLPMETQRAAGDGAPPRKRGRRSGRQTSQDTPSANLPSQEISAYEAAITAAFQTGMLEAQQNMSNSTLPLSYLKNVATANPGTSANPSYPTMNIDPLKAVRNPGMNMKHIEQANKTLKSTMSAEDFSKSTKMNPIPSSSYALTNPTKPNSMDAASIKERAGSSNHAKTKTPVSRVGPTDATKNPSKYPPSPPIQPIRLNTSPYKAQTTAIEKPPQFSYNRKSDVGGSGTTNNRKDPPAAHSQTASKRKRSETANADSDVEIIDLTTKSPEKDTRTEERKSRVLNLVKPSPVPPDYFTSKPVTSSASKTKLARTVIHSKTNTSSPSPNHMNHERNRSKLSTTPTDTTRRETVISMPKVSDASPFVRNQSPSTPTNASPLPVPRYRAPNPVSGNPSPTYVDLRAIANNPIPAVATLRVIPNPRSSPPGPLSGTSGVKYSRANTDIPTSRSSKETMRSSVIIPQPPMESTQISVSKSHPSMERARPTLANSRNSGEISKNHVSNSALNVEHAGLNPRPTTSNPTKTQAPYPLPPKKKHLMMNPPATDDDEVICLD